MQRIRGTGGERLRGMGFISQNAVDKILRKGRKMWVSGLVQPFGTFGGFAGVDVDGLLAVFTLHGATPLKLALALRDAFYARGVVAPPTTHDLAAVGPPGCLVTDPTGGTQ